MKTDPAEAYFPYYFAILALLGIGSWLIIRSRPTAQEKKKWSDRCVVVVGVFVVGSICSIQVLWKQYLSIPISLAAGIVITLLNLRNTYYCDACGKRSYSQQWFSSSFHCPHCGHKLR